MSWFDFISKGSGTTQDTFPDIFPIPIANDDFVSIDMESLYARIITDTLERTHGIPSEMQGLLWDNCLASESSDGLVSMLAKAMASKKELYLVYAQSLKLIRKATDKEQMQIQADYKANGESSIGIYVTFKNYKRTDMLKFYSMLEYCTIGGFWKQANLSKALILKFSDLRASVSLAQSADVKSQGKALADALSQGKDIAMDAKDIIELLKPDMSTNATTMDFIAEKKSFYLGMPSTYITGEAPKGLGDSGKGDAKSTERGLKAYYFSITKPVIEGIFGVNTTFKSDDSDGLSVALETLKTMDITSDEYLSKENKTLIVNKSFGLDSNEIGDESDTPIVPPQSNAR